MTDGTRPGPYKALFVGVIDAEYPRNRRLREFLAERCGTASEIVLIDDEPGYLRKSFQLLRRTFPARRGSYSLVVVPEFALKYAALAWVVSRYHRVPLLVDWFVGLHETRVGDWAETPSVRGRLALALDKFAVRLATILATDTEVRARMLSDDYGSTRRAIALPVGAPDWARPRPRLESEALRVLYYGSYQPLHGLGTFVSALAQVADKSRIKLTLIGSGNTRPDVEQTLDQFGLKENCTFIDSVPEVELGTYIADADVVLGIFGDSKKASTVIANKVWQGLACNRVVLTRSSSALGELREIAGPLLVEVDSAAAITGLMEQWLLDPHYLQSATVPGIDAELEAYVESKYELLKLELRRHGLS